MKIDLQQLESALECRWWSVDELAEYFASGRTQIRDALLELAQRRAIFKTGRGVSGLPARYRICAIARDVKVLA